MINKLRMSVAGLVLFGLQLQAANRIDSLKSDEDVVTFLKSVNEPFNSPKYDKIELRSSETIRKDQPCDGIAEKWQVKNWEKGDFNSDGRTDLLVILYWYNYGIYAVLDKGNNQFGLLTLSYNVHDPCKLAKLVKMDGRQLLLYYGEKDTLDKGSGETRPANRIDTLVFRHGDFVEYNAQPPAYQLDSIQFHTGYCFGSCPVFKIRMDKNGNAEYEAGSYNPKPGTFKTVIRKLDLAEILDLINYLRVPELANNYSVSWTDEQTVNLRVRFSDGKVKSISDYGLRGTFGLRLLYNKFFELRTNQEWVIVN